MSGRRRCAGFTLTELLIVGAVMSVVLGGMLVTLINGQASYLFLETSVQVQEEARRAFDAMVREIREAGHATVANGVLDFQTPLGYNLTLNGCEASKICWGALDGANQPQPGWHVRYYAELSEGRTQLVREVLNGETSQLKRVLTTLVDGSAASPLFAVSGDVITVNLQLKTPQNYLLPGGVQSFAPLTAKINLRNPSA